MSMIRLENMDRFVVVCQLRKVIAEQAEKSEDNVLHLVVKHERSGIDVHFDLVPATDPVSKIGGVDVIKPTLKYVEGEVWFRENEKIPVLGNLCHMRDGVQALSLQKKRGYWLPEKRYRAFDAMLLEGLKALFPVLFREHEFQFSDSGSEGNEGGSHISTSYFTNKWYGPRRPEGCTHFAKNELALEKEAKGIQVYKICANCIGSDLGCEEFEALKSRAIKRTLVEA